MGKNDNTYCKKRAEKIGEINLRLKRIFWGIITHHCPSFCFPFLFLHYPLPFFPKVCSKKVVFCSSPHLQHLSFLYSFSSAKKRNFPFSFSSSQKKTERIDRLHSINMKIGINHIQTKMCIHMLQHTCKHAHAYIMCTNAMIGQTKQYVLSRNSLFFGFKYSRKSIFCYKKIGGKRNGRRERERKRTPGRKTGWPVRENVCLTIVVHDKEQQKINLGSNNKKRTRRFCEICIICIIGIAKYSWATTTKICSIWFQLLFQFC